MYFWLGDHLQEESKASAKKHSNTIKAQKGSGREPWICDFIIFIHHVAVFMLKSATSWLELKSLPYCGTL